MIVLLIIWNVLLTVGLALAVLINLGKFSRIEREVFENLNKELFAVWENLKALGTKVKTLEAHLETIEKNLENSSGVYQQIENLQETQKGLRQDVDLLLRADDEHPVTAVIGAKTNKGGRPRRGETNNA